MDSHDEIAFIDPLHLSEQMANRHRVLWEGQPATIQGVRDIYPVLSEVAKTKNLHFDFVTDESYFQFLNKYIKRSTLGLLKKDLSAA